MRLLSSGNLRAALFTLLALGSLSLKAAVGPPRDHHGGPRPGAFERSAIAALQSRHFSTRMQIFSQRSALVLAARGDCRLAVRDATQAADFRPLFAQDVRAIGPLTYLYDGHRYDRRPEFALRLNVLEARALGLLGVRRAAPIMVAFASTPGCGAGSFGLADLRVLS